MAGGKELTVITYRGIFQEVEEARGCTAMDTGTRAPSSPWTVAT